MAGSSCAGVRVWMTRPLPICEAGWKHLERLGEHYEGPNDPTLVFFSVEEPETFICNHDEWVPVEL